LGFKPITPKADKAQTIDLSLKLVAELVAFCQINGIPGDSIEILWRLWLTIVASR